MTIFPFHNRGPVIRDGKIIRDTNCCEPCQCVDECEDVAVTLNYDGDDWDTTGPNICQFFDLGLGVQYMRTQFIRPGLNGDDLFDLYLAWSCCYGPSHPSTPTIRWAWEMQTLGGQGIKQNLNNVFITQRWGSSGDLFSCEPPTSSQDFGEPLLSISSLDNFNTYVCINPNDPTLPPGWNVFAPCPPYDLLAGNIGESLAAAAAQAAALQAAGLPDGANGWLNYNFQPPQGFPTITWTWP